MLPTVGTTANAKALHFPLLYIMLANGRWQALNPGQVQARAALSHNSCCSTCTHCKIQHFSMLQQYKLSTVKPSFPNWYLKKENGNFKYTGHSLSLVARLQTGHKAPSYLPVSRSTKHFYISAIFSSWDIAALLCTHQLHIYLPQVRMNTGYWDADRGRPTMAS